jgi:hypothetical protein
MVQLGYNHPHETQNVVSNPSAEGLGSEQVLSAEGLGSEQVLSAEGLGVGTGTVS